MRIELAARLTEGSWARIGSSRPGQIYASIISPGLRLAPGLPQRAVWVFFIAAKLFRLLALQQVHCHRCDRLRKKKGSSARNTPVQRPADNRMQIPESQGHCRELYLINQSGDADCIRNKIANNREYMVIITKTTGEGTWMGEREQTGDCHEETRSVSSFFFFALLFHFLKE